MIHYETIEKDGIEVECEFCHDDLDGVQVHKITINGQDCTEALPLFSLGDSLEKLIEKKNKEVYSYA